MSRQTVKVGVGGRHNRLVKTLNMAGPKHCRRFPGTWEASEGGKGADFPAHHRRPLVIYLHDGLFFCRYIIHFQRARRRSFARRKIENSRLCSCLWSFFYVDTVHVVCFLFYCRA